MKTTRLALMLLALVLAGPGGARAGTCGDGIRNGNEECDGADLGGITCQHLCFDSGTLACQGDCTFDTRGCTYCGDGIWQPGEKCDGADPGPLNGDPSQGPNTCQNHGRPEGGVLGCVSTCDAWDFNGCYVCNDGKLDPPEECDGTLFRGQTCPAGSYAGSYIQCGNVGGFCKVDYSNCHYCGDGRVDTANGEQCDHGANNGTPGDGCSSNCRLTCGNGVVDANEECDDGNTVNGDGCDQFCSLESPYLGGTTGDTTTANDVTTSSTTIDQCGSVVSVSGVTNGATVSCTDGTVTCDKGTTANQCTFTYFICFARNDASCGVGSGHLARISLLSGQTGTDQANFINLAKSVLGPSAVQNGNSVSVTPPLSTLDLCGGAQISVTKGTPQTLRWSSLMAGFCQSGAHAGQLCTQNSDCGTGVSCATIRTDQDQVTFQCN